MMSYLFSLVIYQVLIMISGLRPTITCAHVNTETIIEICSLPIRVRKEHQHFLHHNLSH